MWQGRRGAKVLMVSWPWLDQALGCATEAIERMPERKLLTGHAAIVASAYEREWWRRFPDGRDE